MTRFKTREQPCYSVRLIQPFVQLLATYPGFPVAMLNDLKRLDPEARLPIADVHELLRGAVAITGDEDLGLKAGRAMGLGDTGALDYAMSSAATVGDALEMGTRYARLLNDALDVRLERDGERAMVRLESEALLPRAAEDFMMSSFYGNPAGQMLRSLPGLQCWLLHTAPADTREYVATFGAAILRFSAPFSGFVFGAELLAQPLPSADPNLHSVIRQHAERALGEMPSARSMTEAVRRLLLKELAHGQPTADHIAHLLHTSPRTLARKLEAEDTTFTDLLDDLRRRLALQYLASRDLALSELTFLLGFSHTAAFHRAFKRWTGQTPLEYRRAHGR